MNINKENYEEFLFDYMEGNLSAEEHAELKAIIEKDEFLKSELAAFEQTILVPSDDVEYPYKDALLKQDKKTRIIPLYTYISVGVAAAIVLLAIVFMPNAADNTLPDNVAENTPNTISKETENTPHINSDNFTEEIAPITADNEVENPSTPYVSVVKNTPTGATETPKQTLQKIDPITAYTLNHTYPLKDAEKIDNPGYVDAPGWDVINAANTANTTTPNTDGNTPLIPAFKKAVLNEAGDLWASIKKPSIKLFTKDDEGKKKLQLILQYDTYQALIRVR